MSLNWDKLRIFHAVAEAKSLTQAAHILNISQSALSRQITALEEQLATPLFYRHARGLNLTKQGNLLYTNTKDICRRLDMVERQLQDCHDEVGGLLKITAPRIFDGSPIISNLYQFENQYPDIKINVTLSNKSINLSSQHSDIYLSFTEPQKPTLIKRKITTIKFYICASQDYLDKHGTPQCPSDLHNHRLIGYLSQDAYQSQYTDWLFDLANTDKIMHKHALLINSMMALKEFVMRGSGIACLPEFLIKDIPDVKIILESYIPPEKDLFFIYAEEQKNSKKISAFRDFLIDVFHNH